MPLTFRRIAGEWSWSCHDCPLRTCAYGRLYDGRLFRRLPGISQYLGGVVANFASVPKDLVDPLQTLPVYTSLFNKLGIAAVVCTFIALAVLPLMRRLIETHHSHNNAADRE